MPVGAHFRAAASPLGAKVADNFSVDPHWVFSRDGDRLEIRRETVDEGIVLVIEGPDSAPHSYLFTDLAKLESFQTDMERLLLDTHWAFEEFGPDRRSGHDRRSFPRINNDRRRWWTDSRRGSKERVTRS